jgi:hypothetical protein
MQKMHNPHLFKLFMAWKFFVITFEKVADGKYHEFKHSHDVQIEE